MPAATPLLRQYLEIKNRYPDTLLLFQMGEFFETFYEDAEIASRALDIALTSRNREAEGPVPLAGFPIAAASSYISRLVKQGFKVAVCEQVEEPVPGKGLVKREVTRQITPGVDVETDNLRREKHHYLLGLTRGEGERWGLAFVDVSTGANAFTDNSADHGLSAVGRSFLAGQLAHARGMCAVLAPLNSPSACRSVFTATQTGLLSTARALRATGAAFVPESSGVKTSVPGR
jgi:DNA mismatch repair ATPase MutS